MKLRIWVVAVGLCVVTRVADAQEVEGPGYRLSEGTVLHPSAGVETGVISNVFFEESDEEPLSSAVLRVVAKIAIASEPPKGRDGRATSEKVGEFEAAGYSPDKAVGTEKISFRAGLGLEYEEYLSSNESVQDQRNLGVGADVDLGFLPRNTVSFLVSDNFVRHTRPTNFESGENLARDVNRLRLGLRWRPSGRTLSGILGYENKIDVFENDNVEFANRMQQDINLRVNWQYLPVTLFYVKASQGFYGGLGSNAAKVESNPLRFQLGAASAITSLTTVRTHVGWAFGFYDTDDSYSGLIFNAEFGLRYAPRGRVVVGVTRDFVDSINANYYSEYKVYSRLEQQLGVLVAKAALAYHRRTYEGPLPPGVMPVDPTEDRTDDVVSASAQLAYYYREWLAVMFDYTLASVSTDFRVELPGPGGMGTREDNPGYVRHQAILGAHAAF